MKLGGIKKGMKKFNLFLVVMLALAVTVSARDFNIKNDSDTFLYVEDSSGYVGMGTDTPSQKLNVEGNVLVAGNLLGTIGTSYGGAAAGAGVSTSTPVAFSTNLFGTSQTGVQSGVATKVNWTTERFDYNSDFYTHSESDSETGCKACFRPSVAGRYILTAGVTISSLVDANYVLAILYKNGVPHSYGSFTETGGSISGRSVVSAIVDSDGDDYFEIYAQHDRGTDQSINGGIEQTYFSGALLNGAGNVSNYFKNNSNNIYYDQGWVGVGTQTINSVLTVGGNITPSVNNTYSLGTPDLAWKDMYIGANTLYIGGKKLSNNAGDLEWDGSSVAAASSVWSTSGSDAYYNTGKVGIGTSSPGATLHVDGQINVTPGNDICIDGGNCLSTGGSGMWTNSNGNATFMNNVGIGTATPEEVFHISKDGNALQIIESTNSNAVQLRLKSDSENRRIVGLNSLNEVESQIVLENSGEIKFSGAVLDTNLSMIISSGNVGIGVSNPRHKLDILSTDTNTSNGIIKSNHSADTSGSAIISSYRSRGNLASVQQNDVLGLFRFYAYNGSEYTTPANINLFVENISNGKINSSIKFNLIENNVKNEVLRMTNLGVGIGTDSPEAQLHVVGDGSSEDLLMLEQSRAEGTSYLSITNAAPNSINNKAGIKFSAMTDVTERNVLTIQGSFNDPLDESRTSRIDFKTAANSNYDTSFAIVGNKVSIAHGIPVATLDVSGSIALALTTKTSAYTITLTDHVVLTDATSGAFTVTLPTASSAANIQYTIKKTDSTANAITIDGNGAETIDGATTKTLTTQYESLTIVSDGTEWWII